MPFSTRRKILLRLTKHTSTPKPQAHPLPPFLRLPPELLLQITRHLPPASLIILSTTCRDLWNLTSPLSARHARSAGVIQDVLKLRIYDIPSQHVCPTCNYVYEWNSLSRRSRNYKCPDRSFPHKYHGAELQVVHTISVTAELRDLILRSHARGEVFGPLLAMLEREYGVYSSSNTYAEIKAKVIDDSLILRRTIERIIHLRGFMGADVFGQLHAIRVHFSSYSTIHGRVMAIVLHYLSKLLNEAAKITRMGAHRALIASHMSSPLLHCAGTAMDLKVEIESMLDSPTMFRIRVIMHLDFGGRNTPRFSLQNELFTAQLVKAEHIREALSRNLEEAWAEERQTTIEGRNKRGSILQSYDEQSERMLAKLYSSMLQPR